MEPKPLDLEDVRKEVFKWIVGGPANEAEEFFDFVMCEVKQRIKQACEFYLKYKDNPRLLVEDYPEFEEKIKEMEWIPNLDFERCAKEEFIEKGNCDICPLKVRCWEGQIIKNEYFKENYNEWLFKLAFKEVLK